MMRHFLLKTIPLLLVSLTVQAQDLLIRDASVYAGGEIRAQTDILIRAGKIKKLGRNLRAGGDIRVIDAAGRVVTPGLFGGLSSIGLSEISGEAATVDQRLDLEEMRPEFDVSLAYNPASSLVAIARVEGVLYSLLTPSASDSIIEGRGAVVRLDGRSLPRGKKVLFISVGGAGKGDAGGSRAAQYMLLEQAFAEAGDDSGESESFEMLTRTGRQVLRDRNMPYVFHVDRAVDIRRAIDFIRRHKLDGVIAGGAEAWVVAAELAAAGIPVILDPLANLPVSFDSLGARLDNAALLQRAGVKVIFSGSGAHNLRKIRQAAGNAVANGMPREAALAAITSVPAGVFGYSGGSLEKDAPATLVIWDGDPLEVISAADQVIIDGRPIPMVSRQTLLRDRYLPAKGNLPRAYIKP